MAREVTDRLSDLKLTSDEVGKLKKAFGDPEFRKLFKEYAEEISDPQNRKRYEEEIRLMEMERGMDVEFVNPTPGHCLKTRHWPNITTANQQETGEPIKDKSSEESVKVFINVCKSDKVECPVMKASKNSSGKHVPNGCYWSLPHCFSPSREDLDKKKNRVMVYDVAFHPKAFDLAVTSPAMRRLLDVTAVEGVQRQFNLCLGKTAQQATNLAQLFKNVRDSTALVRADTVPETTLGRSEAAAREEAILRAVILLKGVTYKGVARPTVIRRRRPDFDQKQAEVKKRTDEDIASCTDPAQREAIQKLASYPFSGDSANGDKKTNTITTGTGSTDEPIEPKYTITHSSDYDMINCRDAPDVNPLRAPDRLRIVIKLPGLTSSSCLDLDVTSTQLSLQSERPMKYKLDLKLPYEVDDSLGEAKFDKSSSTLTVTVPLLPKKSPNDSIDSLLITSSTESVVCLTPSQTTVTSTPPSSPTGGEPTCQPTHSKRKRRKRNRRRSSASEQDEAAVLSVTAGNSSPVPTEDSKASNNDDAEPNDRQSNDTPTVVPSQTEAFRPETSDSSGFTIPVGQIGINQLLVTKDRRLAPVRFRQDPFSVSILLPVRGILPESMALSWAVEPIETKEQDDSLVNDDSDSLTTSCFIKPLLLLLTFASRGAGGCTMDWGVVLRCPSYSNETEVSCRERFSPDKLNLESRSPQAVQWKSNVYFYKQDPPKIVSSAFSPINAILILAKPPLAYRDDASLKFPNKVRQMMMNPSIWWNSVAVGRTLTAGMQEYPFVGVESCLSGQPSAVDPSASSEQTDQYSGCVWVNSLSDACCDIMWSRSGNIPSQDLLQSSLSSIPAQSEPLTYRLRRDPQGSAPVVLKGILKQRSYSESSGDEQVSHAIGIADTGVEHLFSSDEFPSATSGDEDNTPPATTRSKVPSSIFRIRRCVSNEKLVSTTGDSFHVHPGGRQRRRSVNFSSQDQHIAYSPRDTVEALHHTLASRRKKARRREARRRPPSGGERRSSDPYSPQSPKKNDRQAAHFFSGNNSVSTVPAEVIDNRQSTSASDKSNPIVNSGDHPATTVADSNESKPLGTSPLSNGVSQPDTVPETLVSSNLEPITANAQQPCARTPLWTDTGEKLPHNHLGPCAVPLSAVPILELDEE